MFIERLHPYLFFLLASALFMMFGSGLQLVLPVQVALSVAEVSCMLGFALFMRHHWGEPRREGGWPSWRVAGGPWWLLMATFLAGGLFGLCANAIGGVIVELVPGLSEQAEGYAESVERMLYPESWALRIAAIVSVTVSAPLCEEALFRGFLLPLQRESERLIVAIALNGLLFGLLHMNPMAMLSLTLLGMALAALTTKSGSLWPAILCHAGVNTCNGVVIPQITRALGVDTSEAQASLGALLGLGLGGLALSSLVLVALLKGYGGARQR